MTAEGSSRSLAVLIDADNASAKYAQAIFEEIAKFGEANVRRIYGDFSRGQLAAWDEAVKSLAILQHQQRNNTTGKNAADIALVIDAMDLMHKGKLDGFCLISSDSDFTRLAQRLREENLEVFGFGESKTPEAFRNACNTFIYVENLLELDGPSDGAPTSDVRTKEAAKPATRARKPGDETNTAGASGAAKRLETDKPGEASLPKPFTAAVPLILKAMKQAEDNDGWFSLAVIGSVLRKLHPDFDPRTYGCAKLSDLAKKTGQFQTKSSEGAGPLIARKTQKPAK